MRYRSGKELGKDFMEKIFSLIEKYGCREVSLEVYDCNEFETTFEGIPEYVLENELMLLGYAPVLEHKAVK